MRTFTGFDMGHIVVDPGLLKRVEELEARVKALEEAVRALRPVPAMFSVVGAVNAPGTPIGSGACG